MTQFNYKEIDAEGWETLEAIAGAEKFNRWMYETIRPYCKGKVFEIGSGIGNISRYFIEANADITLSDIRPSYCNVLKQKFPNAGEIVELNLTHPQFESQYKNHLEQYDSVFALNVVEHIEDDKLAIENARRLLKTDGNLIILVPAYQSLYNRFDRELEHYRRYNRKRLNQLLANTKLTIRHSQYFNFMGIPGWYVSGKIQKNKTIPKGQMKLYNSLVPVFKLVDNCLFHSVGLSVISVGTK